MSREHWRGEERDLGRVGHFVLSMQAAFLAGFLRIWGRTWRIDEDEEQLRAIRDASPRGAVIYAFWHNRMIMLAYSHRKRKIQVLRSSSRDGQLIAELLVLFGYGAIAGSTSRGGAAGLRKLLSLDRKGLDTAITVDGPRGPRGRLKGGVVQLAALSGSPIVPTAVSPKRAHIFKSWDRTIFPMPFTRLKIRYGEAIYLSREDTRGDQEAIRRSVEEKLRDFSDQLDESMGRNAIPPDPRELSDADA